MPAPPLELDSSELAVELESDGMLLALPPCVPVAFGEDSEAPEVEPMAVVEPVELAASGSPDPASVAQLARNNNVKTVGTLMRNGLAAERGRP